MATLVDSEAVLAETGLATGVAATVAPTARVGWLGRSGSGGNGGGEGVDADFEAA